MDQSPRVLVLLADGAEEMEVTITVDVLRRGGVEVVLAGLDGAEAVGCSRGMRLVPDVAFSAVASQEFDAIVLPGGAGGSDRLAASAEVGVALRRQVEAGRVVAAICAAPAALAAHGIGAGAKMTSHPAVREAVASHADYSERSVVIDGDLITSRGPGTAFDFALALVERLRGGSVVAEIRAPMMLDSGAGQ